MKKTLFILLILLFFNIPAEPLESIEFFSGHLRANLPDSEGAYSGKPFLVSFNFRAPDFLRETDYSSWEMIVEPFVSFLDRPEKSTESGVNCLLKYNFARGSYFSPYVKFGLGAAYIARGTKNQRGGFNFLPQAGAGMSFPFRENTFITFEYRFRHLSNAALRMPNAGIDAHMFLVGVKFVL